VTSLGQQIDELENKRHNKLMEMTSNCDQCLKEGVEYQADDRDVDQIRKWDEDILDKLYKL
jgi:hypothetical protein